MGDLINQAYAALEQENYTQAEVMLLQSLSKQDGFNARLGLAVCYFNQFMSHKKTLELDLAIHHSQEAVDIYDGQFDIHFLLGQAYAAKYFQTSDTTFRDQSFRAYAKSREFVKQRPGIDAPELDKRVQELMMELFDEKWN